ncbi:MAG: hypothetical protein Q4P31_03865 [Andreesenia angusta]|nr:hypothetical protein [Andreesenia angusta]
MLKRINVNLEPVESMLYYWSSVSDKEKVAESFFIDVANMEAMKSVFTDEFNAESVRKVLSSIQNAELLSTATKPEKRFWSNNMWMMEDLGLTEAMAQPIKVLNLNHLVERLNDEIPDIDKEEITVYFAPLHLDPYYIVDDKIIINFFRIMVDLYGDNSVKIEGESIEDFCYEKLKELLNK